MIWKLLRQHISVGQLAGFFLANLFGMFIVMLACQFYSDVNPVFTAPDSFLKNSYLIIGKRSGAASTFSSAANGFSAAEVDEISSQPFAKTVGVFTSAEYKVEARMSIAGSETLNSDITFESVPDAFVDTDLRNWKYAGGQTVVPIILPRSYIAMYNFGFAKGKSLPKLSEGLVGMIDITLLIHGNGNSGQFKGRVIGFSNRLNTILVPQSFIEWSNARYAPDSHTQPSRIILEVATTADDAVAKYIESHGYETYDDNLQAEKTTWFLRLVVTMVMAVGIVITLLSFYILMLSIYLLVQKNTDKLQSLLLIGYSPQSVARPYQLLTLLLNIGVLVFAVCLLCLVRSQYMDILVALFPDIPDGSLLPSLSCGLVLLVVVTLLNSFALRAKIVNLWKQK